MVTNTGGVAVSGNVVDDNGTPGNLADDVTVGTFTNLAPTATATFTRTVNITGEVTNIATATATAGTLSTTDTATATVNGHTCTITVTKTPRVTDVCNGKPIIYDIEVTNNSDEFDWTGNVTDTILGTLDTNTSILAGDSESYTPSHNTTGQVDNTVTASGNFDDGSSTSASDSATVYGHVCRITIVKDAQPNDLHDFPFNFSGGGQNVDFLLDDDAGVPGIGEGDDHHRGNLTTFDGLTLGVKYTILETPQNLFALQAPVVCTGATGLVTPISNGVEVTVQLDTDAVCTFVNVKTALTRTLGFWKTHTDFTSMVFNAAPLNGSMTIRNVSSGKYVTINSTAYYILQSR